MTFPRIGFRWIVTLCRCRRQFISINQSIFGTHRNSAALNKQWKSTRPSSSCTVARAVGVAAVIIINYLSSLRFSLENNNSPALTCENGKKAPPFVRSLRRKEARHTLKWHGTHTQLFSPRLSYPAVVVALFPTRPPERFSRMENILMSL